MVGQHELRGVRLVLPQGSPAAISVPICPGHQPTQWWRRGRASLKLCFGARPPTSPGVGTSSHSVRPSQPVSKAGRPDHFASSTTASPPVQPAVTSGARPPPVPADCDVGHFRQSRTGDVKENDRKRQNFSTPEQPSVTSCHDRPSSTPQHHLRRVFRGLKSTRSGQCGRGDGAQGR